MSALVVAITHEPFLPWFVLTYEGKTEELDHEQCLEWFKVRGARDMDKVNDAINQAYNFHAASVSIENPVTPPTLVSDIHAPRV